MQEKEENTITPKTTLIACPLFVAQEMANPTNIDARSRFDTFQNQCWCAVHNMYAATIWCVWWLWSCCAFSTVFYFVAFNIIFFTRWNLSDTEYKIDLEIHTTALVSSRSSICMAAWKIWCFLLMQVLLQSIFAHIVCCLILFFPSLFLIFFVFFVIVSRVLDVSIRRNHIFRTL